MVLAVTPAMKAFPGGGRHILDSDIPTREMLTRPGRQELLFASLKWGPVGTSGGTKEPQH